MKKVKRYSSTQMVVYTGLFIALTILLQYVFAIKTTFVHVNFGYLSVAIYAALFGPWRAGVMAALTTFLATTVFGQGIFFPGFLLSDFLTGFIYGWVLYGRQANWLRVGLAFLLVDIVIHLGLNTLWLVLFYNKAASAIFMSRLIKNICWYFVEVITFIAVYKGMARFLIRGK